MRGTAFLAMLLLSTRPAFAETLTAFERGTNAYRAVLNRCSLQPTDSIDEVLAKPAQSMVILIGNTNYCDDRFANRGLLRFIRRGGAVMMASDKAYFGEMWNQLEFTVNGSKVISPASDPATLYRGELRECPLLQRPIRKNLASSLDLLGKLRVATNRPSYFNRLPTRDEGAARQDNPDLPTVRDLMALNPHRVIAELPTGSRPMDGSPIAVPEDRLLVGVADNMGQGRYALFADHTMFLNIMMLQTDNDNVAFAMRLTRWLSTDGQRTQVYFVDDGRVRTDFSLNIDYVDPPLPHPDVVGPLVDQLMGDLERSDFFNQGIERLIAPRKILRIVLLTVTVFAAGLFLFRLINSRYRSDRTVARLPDRLSDLPEQRPTHASTPEAIHAAAQELARSSLESILNATIDLQTPPLSNGSRAWASRVKQIWEIAAGRSRNITRPRELERLARDLADLRLAVDRGDVRITIGDHA